METYSLTTLSHSEEMMLSLNCQPLTWDFLVTFILSSRPHPKKLWSSFTVKEQMEISSKFPWLEETIFNLNTILEKDHKGWPWKLHTGKQIDTILHYNWPKNVLSSFPPINGKFRIRVGNLETLTWSSNLIWGNRTKKVKNLFKDGSDFR